MVKVQDMEQLFYAMGRRKGRERQQDLWVAASELPKSGGHLVYRRLIDIETHRAVFSWVLGLLAREGLLAGGTIGIVAPPLSPA